MADKPTSVVLGPEDRKLLSGIRKGLAKEYGTVTFTFIVRLALRSLAEKLGRK